MEKKEREKNKGTDDEAKGIIVIDADLGGSLKTLRFREENPDRYLSCDVDEDTMFGIGVALSTFEDYFIPFVHTFCVFYPNAWFQLYEASIAKRNIKIIASHPGISVGPDGPSHHAYKYLEVFSRPNINIFFPGDAPETEQMVEYIYVHKGPFVLILSRNDLSTIHGKDYKFEPCKIDIVEPGERITMVSYGDALHEILGEGKARQRIINELNLKEDEYPRVVNFSHLNPERIPLEELEKITKGTEILVVSEDHYYKGGLFDRLLGELAKNDLLDDIKKYVHVAVKDYASSDTKERLYDGCLDSETIFKKVNGVYRKKPKNLNKT